MQWLNDAENCYPIVMPVSECCPRFRPRENDAPLRLTKDFSSIFLFFVAPYHRGELRGGDWNLSVAQNRPSGDVDDRSAPPLKAAVPSRAGRTPVRDPIETVHALDAYAAEPNGGLNQSPPGGESGRLLI
jgi:hypothetical protein